MLGLIFSSKLDWGSYITSIAKTAMKFLSREVALNLPYSHVWNTVVMSRLVPLVGTWYFLDMLQKQIWRTIGPLLAASLEPLAHRQNVTSLSLFYRCYFGRYALQNWLNWFHFLFLEGGLLVILIDRVICLPPFLDVCYKDVCVNSFFLRTARLWNSLPIECFPLSYDLSGFKSRINRHLLTVGSF